LLVPSAQSYVEQAPVPALGGAVRVVWIQRIGAEPYVQRHLPTGGVELHCAIGSPPWLVAPLTGPSVEVLAPGTTVVGVRFRPGGAAPMLGLPACELADLTVHLDEIWGRDAIVLGELVSNAGSPEMALSVLQAHLVRRMAAGADADLLVSEAVRRLMPWRAGHVGSVGSELAISHSQLRRRCLATVGIGPKALHRTLRFQGFLALVQAGELGAEPRTDYRLAALAAEAGYADQAHLSRECQRLTRLPPRAFLTDRTDKCGCGHDHSASFIPLLRAASACSGRLLSARSDQARGSVTVLASGPTIWRNGWALFRSACRCRSTGTSPARIPLRSYHWAPPPT
jgi:AraC-like DNA-binding protein